MKKYIPTFLFAVFIFGFSLVDTLTPPREFSDLENRYLTQYTPPTVESLMDNRFTADFDSYINDQFVFRSDWISLKSVGESLLLKTENNGIVYGKNNYMFDKSVKIDEERLYKNLEFVSEFGKLYGEEQDIYFSLVPSSYSILPDYLPTGLTLPDQLEISKKTYKGFENSSVTPIDLSDTLLKNKNDYIYYRTDHHWTTGGAYLAYQEFCKRTDMAPIDLENTPKNTVEDFYGTYYSKAKLLSTLPDTITYYDIPTDMVGIDEEVKDGLYDLEQFEKHDKYAGFLYNNNGETLIASKDAEQGNGKRLLIIKDSYGNSLAPFFSENYDYIFVIDLRYTESIEELVTTMGFSDIYIIYSLPNFSTDSNLIKLLPE